MLIIFLFALLIVWHFIYHNSSAWEKAFMDGEGEKAVKIMEENLICPQENPKTRAESLERAREISKEWESFLRYLKDCKTELLSPDKIESYNYIIEQKVEFLKNFKKEEYKKSNYYNHNEWEEYYEIERELARENDPYMGMSEDEFFDWNDSRNDN